MIALLFGYALIEEWDLNVFEDGELWDEVEGLEDEAEFFATDFGEFFVGHVCDVDVVEEVLAGGWPIEAAEDVHEGRLAGTGWAHDGEILALGDVDGGITEGMNGRSGFILLVCFADVGDSCNDICHLGRAFLEVTNSSVAA